MIYYHLFTSRTLFALNSFFWDGGVPFDTFYKKSREQIHGRCPTTDSFLKTKVLFSAGEVNVLDLGESAEANVVGTQRAFFCYQRFVHDFS